MPFSFIVQWLHAGQLRRVPALIMALKVGSSSSTFPRCTVCSCRHSGQLSFTAALPSEKNAYGHSDVVHGMKAVQRDSDLMRNDCSSSSSVVDSISDGYTSTAGATGCEQFGCGHGIHAATSLEEIRDVR